MSLGILGNHTARPRNNVGIHYAMYSLGFVRVLLCTLHTLKSLEHSYGFAREIEYIYVLYSVSLPTITVISFLLRYFMNNRFAFLSLSVRCTNVNIDMLQWDIVRSITFLFHLLFFYSTSLSIFCYLCIFPGNLFLGEHRDYFITGSSNRSSLLFQTSIHLHARDRFSFLAIGTTLTIF